MNKLLIHTHVISRPRNAMFSLLNTFRIGKDDVIVIIVILYG